jgi:uncharacterized protein (DUF4415 family)
MGRINDANPPLTDEDLSEFRPAQDVLPAEVIAAFKSRGGRPVAKNPKVLRSIRLDKDLLDALETTDPNWRQTINDTMRAKVFGENRG